MTEVSGEGFAELQDEDTIEIEFSYHDGGNVILKAVREPACSTAC